MDCVLPAGRVYGVLLNHRSAMESLGDAVRAPPYGAAPVAPVLFIKPRNTYAGHGDAIVVPPDASELEIAGGVGVVMARTACRVRIDTAMDFVAGYVVVNDIGIPHRLFYRPSIRHKARDGFCPVGARMTPRAAAGNPDALTVQVRVDEDVRSTYSTAGLVRSVAQLLADVTEFMTLSPGDVLALGAAWPLPRARAGQIVRVEVEGLGSLENRLIAPDEGRS